MPGLSLSSIVDRFRSPPAVNIPKVPILSAKRATDLYGTPDGDPHGAWAKANIVYCGGGGKAEKPAMPGVPPHLWFAIHKRAEPKLREAFRLAQLADPEHTIESAGGWVYRRQRHDTPEKARAEGRPLRPLSNHSWGAAVDVDAAENRALTVGAIEPWSARWRKLWPAGLSRAWVEAFVSVGGIGAGMMWRPWADNMHFEVYDPEG